MNEHSQFLQEKTTCVLEETLENMAFISVDGSSKQECTEIEGERLNANLLITKPVLLEMRLEMSRELLVQIVETMYIMDREEITDQLIGDLLAEILNTLAGRFMTETLPADQTFSLNLPELTEVVDDAPEAKRFTYYYLAEEYPLIVEITMADDTDLSIILNNN